MTNLTSPKKGSPFNYFLEAYRKYATFGGRASRKEFWFFMLFYSIIILALAIVDSILFGVDDDGALLPGLFGLASILPFVAITCRRLHDINKSGWWQLIQIVPIIGFIVLVVWLAKAGDAGDNQYGPKPLN